LVDRKRPGIDQDIAKLGGSRRPASDKEMGSRPGQWHSATLIPGHISPDRSRMHTIYAGRGGAMDTVYGGDPWRQRNTFFGGGAGNMHTIYAGRGGSMHTIYAGRGGAMNTVYAGGKGVMNTVYAGGRGAMDTIYAGGRFNTFAGSGPRQGVSQIVTREITHPSTRQPVTISYNQVTGLYLDQSLNRWLPAPPWISAQFRR